MIELRELDVYRDGVLVARLEQSTYKGKPIRDSWHVVGTDGQSIGYVRQACVNWRVGWGPARYHTLERAVQELLRRRKT